MFLRKLVSASSALALIAVSGIALFSFYSYKTGCTADLKTGSLGDPQLALHFSSIAFAWLITGVVSGTLSICLLRGVDASTRAGMAIAFFFLGTFAFWLLGWYFEAVGLESCFAP